MKTFKKFFTTISFRQLLTVFLAGIIFVASTACSRIDAAVPPESSSQLRNTTMSDQGMNSNLDIQKGRNTNGVGAKTERLVQETKNRAEKVQSPQEYVDEITPDKSVERQIEDLGKTAKKAAGNVQQSAQDAAEGTKKGVENLKKNAKNTIDQATDAIQ